MRNVMIVLGLLTVLALAGPTFAGNPINTDGLVITDEPTAGFSEPGFRSYLFRLGGKKAFANIQILDERRQLMMVSQANKFYVVWEEGAEFEQAAPTPWLISMPTRLKSVDTHFMFAMPGTVLPGSTFTETNDKSNWPTPIPVVGGYYAGLGTFSSVGGFAFATELPVGTPFMQIVVPDSAGNFCLRLMTPINGVDTYVEHWLPEPGSITMLVVGALCLVAMRFRKRRVA